VIVPDLDDNELMSRNKVIAKPVDGQKSWRDIGLADIRDADKVLPEPVVLKPAKTRYEAFIRVIEAIGIVDGVAKVSSPVGEVIIYQDKLYHFVDKVDAKRERYANFIKHTLRDPLEIWEVAYTDGSIRLVYIAVFDGKKDFVVTVWTDAKGNIFWNAIPVSKRTNYLNNLRKGKLIYFRGK